MRVLRGLVFRIVVASLLCGVLGLCSALFVVATRAVETARNAAGPLFSQLARYERPRCEADPAGWSLAFERDVRAFAYDGATGRSSNPTAPPLDRALVARLAPDEGAVAFGATTFGRTGTVVLRVRDRGPCAVVQGTWPRSGFVDSFSDAAFLGSSAIFASALGVALLAVIRPLTRRIARLRRAADHIGALSGFALDPDPAADDLAELGARIVAAHERICADEAALRAREDQLRRFLADVTHDLRTPLSSLQLALERASDVCSDEDLGELIARALDDTVYIAGLTTNLRMASLLREGWNPAEESPSVDLKETIERVVERCRIFARRRSISVEIGTPDDAIVVACNPIAAEQAVANVLENAVAHGDPGGHVAVVLCVLPERRFRVTVLDDGPGVAPQELPRLSERAFRSDVARARDPRGSGLGLAITREIADRCGWTLAFTAAEPRGLRVEITGPLGETSAPAG